MKPRILIIDDQISFCEILEEILRDEGYTPSIYHTARTGLEAFENEIFDMILVDLSLPDGDGVDLATRMMAQRPDTPVVVITAYASVERAVDAVKKGAYDFLEKPLDLDRFLITLRNGIAWRAERQKMARYQKSSISKYQMVGQTPPIQQVYEIIDKVAPRNASVLILGPSGSGKELVARAIHDQSPRASRSMVTVNCASIPEGLIESELFGHEKGAFTHAVNSRDGKFQLADKGTIFLDEIGDLSLPAQAKVLRTLASGEVTRIGSKVTRYVDVRVIAATHRDLMKMIQDGTFREDLYYRLNVITITVPALTERREDIPLLLDYFSSYFAEKEGTFQRRFSRPAMNFLKNYEWPGNVRELRSFIERLMILSNHDLIDLEHCHEALQNGRKPSLEQGQGLRERTDEFQRGVIRETLEMTHGNKAQAARILKVDRANLQRTMQRLGLEG